MKALTLHIVTAAFFLLGTVSCSQPPSAASNASIPAEYTISKEKLLDKIKGGWAGQTIGCTYGGPTEFKYNGTMIQDYVPIVWPDGYIKWWYENVPGLYDDVYMDLTFVDVFDRLGLDAPVDSFAVAFATAGYTLWHANQSARYNILQGIMPPASGHWLNNPHADDLDYQIEADYAGLMAPGMPNTASEISDKIGHIMNYGDGWYGGVYVGAMYALAFVSDDIPFIVTEALKTIPEQSIYYKCMSDVIRWHQEYPDDWKRTWFECEKKWSSDIGCPDGVFVPFNIDAVINSAYILIGLLYGEGDFYKTLDISTRCGQDSDCNPASAGGILGTILGYSRIPDYWMKNLKEVEDMDFAYTTISLNKTYRMGFDQALKVIERNGGKVSGDEVTIKCQQPVPVRYEKAFEGMYPTEKVMVNKLITEVNELAFDGTGVVFKGYVNAKDEAYVAKVEMYLDGQLVEIANLPASYTTRRNDLFWKYQLPKGKHLATFKWLNPQKDASIHFTETLIYSDAPKSEPQAEAPQPVNLILDTDLGPDYDDVGAMAVLHALADSGQVNILATVSSNRDERVVPCIEVINTYFGRPDIPVGAPKCESGVTLTAGHKTKWTDVLPAKYAHHTEKSSDAPDAVNIYRKVLSGQRDNSVVVCTIGFFSNLRDLLNSGGDKYSPLTGKELVAKKVKRLVSMAGLFPEGKEFNVYCDAPASKVVAAEWPNEIIFSGFEIGEKILTGKRLVGMNVENSPVKEAYALCFAEGDPDGRMSWDHTAVLVAVKGYEPYYTVERGVFRVVDNEGTNSWTADGNGKHLKLIQKMPPAEMAALLENYMMHQPSNK